MPTQVTFSSGRVIQAFLTTPPISALAFATPFEVLRSQDFMHLDFMIPAFIPCMHITFFKFEHIIIISYEAYIIFLNFLTEHRRLNELPQVNQVSK